MVDPSFHVDGSNAVDNDDRTRVDTRNLGN
jgi:hypothetical protein